MKSPTACDSSFVISIHRMFGGTNKRYHSIWKLPGRKVVRFEADQKLTNITRACQFWTFEQIHGWMEGVVSACKIVPLLAAGLDPHPQGVNFGKKYVMHNLPTCLHIADPSLRWRWRDADDAVQYSAVHCEGDRTQDRVFLNDNPEGEGLADLALPKKGLFTGQTGLADLPSIGTLLTRSNSPLIFIFNLLRFFLVLFELCFNDAHLFETRGAIWNFSIHACRLTGGVGCRACCAGMGCPQPSEKPEKNLGARVVLSPRSSAGCRLGSWAGIWNTSAHNNPTKYGGMTSHWICHVCL